MKLATLALSASLAFGAAAAYTVPALAQNAPGPQGQGQARPAPTPTQASGAISHYVVGPMGHVRGFVLNSGAFVMLHGRGGDELAQRAPVGSAVRVDGFARPGNAQMIHHATVYAADGSVLSAPGPRFGGGFGPGGAQPGGPGGWHHGNGGHGQRRAMMQQRLAQLPLQTARGTVQNVMAGPRGGVHGFLLADGTTVFLGRGMSHALRARGLQVGEQVQVSGRGGSYPQGTSVLAEQLTFADGATITAPVAPQAPDNDAP